MWHILLQIQIRVKKNIDIIDCHIIIINII